MSKSDAKMSPKELRKFGLVTAGMLILFFDLLIPWIWDHSQARVAALPRGHPR